MGIEEINFGLNIFTLICGLYLITFKSYFKEKGKNLAKIEDIEAITEKVEKVKIDFNVKLEGLKSELQKSNIAYQINLSELIKIRFKRIDNLYENLSILRKFIENNMFMILGNDDYKSKEVDFFKIYNTAIKSSIKCNLYVTDELKNNIDEILHRAKLAYIDFCNLYWIESTINKYDSQSEKLNEERQTTLNDIFSLSDEISELLKQLENELKKQVILKVVE